MSGEGKFGGFWWVQGIDKDRVMIRCVTQLFL